MKIPKELYGKIRERLSAYMVGRVYPSEIATTFNFVLYDEFLKAELKPIFVGEYFIDPKNPDQTRVFSHHGTEACSPLPISRGVIGRAIRTKENQHVPDVTKDDGHVGCDPNMEGCELVLIAWDDKKEPIGVLDLDFNIKNVLEESDVLELGKIWDEYYPLIFPKDVKF